MIANDVVLIDARSGDWLNNYLNAEAASSAWYGIPLRMQDHMAPVIIDGGGQIISVLEGVPTGGLQRGRQPAGVAPKAVWLLRTWSARVYR